MKIYRKIIKKIEDYYIEFKIKLSNQGINKDVVFKNPKRMVIGENCRIGENSYILCWENYTYENLFQPLKPNLIIGKNFSATRNLTIQCCNNIKIGNDVLVASNVFICDYNHGINNPEGSYLKNELTVKEVVISDGAWIGQGAYIMPGVHIGKNAVIGAGSIVTKSVPDYCMAVGNPANIIKKYDCLNKRWNSIEM